MKVKSQKAALSDLTRMTEEDESAGSSFTGVARSVECILCNDKFKNFKIVTLHIKNGRVERKEYSEPYATYELIARLEVMNELSILSLKNQWSHGKALKK